MPDLTELSIGESNLILFKGRPTTGKTVATWGFPKPIRYYDLDDKIESIIKMYGPQIKKGDIEFTKFGPYDYELLDVAMEKDILSGNYKTYVIDSLTSLSTMILNYMIKLRGADPQAKGKKKGVVDFNTIEDYGGENNALMDVIGFLKSKGNTSAYRILTAHTIPVETKDASGKVIDTKWELLTGGKKIAAKIPGSFKEIWHFNVEKEVVVGSGPTFKVQFNNDGIDFANTMLPLPRELNWTKKTLFDEVERMAKEKGVVLPR